MNDVTRTSKDMMQQLRIDAAMGLDMSPGDPVAAWALGEIERLQSIIRGKTFVTESHQTGDYVGWEDYERLQLELKSVAEQYTNYHNWAQDEIERLQRANRTRPEYDLRCEDCGRAHILDTSIPSEIWNQIAGDASILCTTCIDDRLVKHGLACEAKFYFVGKALDSTLYPSDLDTPAPTPEPRPAASKERVNDKTLASLIETCDQKFGVAEYYGAMDMSLWEKLGEALEELKERRVSHEPPAVPVFERPKHYGDPIKPVWSYRGQHSLYKSEAWERYAKDVELERDAALHGSHPSTAQPPPPVLAAELTDVVFAMCEDGVELPDGPPADDMAPIACIRVGEDDSCEVLKLYAPGLPTGEHDLYPAASSQPPSPVLSTEYKIGDRVSHHGHITEVVGVSVKYMLCGGAVVYGGDLQPASRPTKGAG